MAIHYLCHSIAISVSGVIRIETRIELVFTVELQDPNSNRSIELTKALRPKCEAQNRLIPGFKACLYDFL